MSTDFSTPPQQERRGYPPLSALRRSRDDRKVVGVSGGLGRWAGVDPLVFRILFVVLTVFGGSGILLYALGWLLIPDDGETESEGQRLLSGRSRSSAATIVGIVVVLAIGIAATGWMLDSGPGFGGLAALVAVVAIVVLISRNHRGPRPVAPTFPDPQVRTPGEPGAYGQTPGTAYSAPAGYPAPAAYAAPAPSYAPTAPLSPPPPGPRYPTYGPPPPPAPPKERSVLGRATLSVALIVVGILIGWNAATDSDVPVRVVLASALAVVALGLVVGAFVGRARGLVVAGVLLMVLSSVAAFSGAHLRGGVGERAWSPTTVAELHTPYRLGAGEITLDLTGLDLSAAGRERVVVRQGVGQLLIVVPSEVVVLVDADVRAGEIRRDVDGDGVGQTLRDGTDVSERFTVPEGSAPSSAVLVIDAELGLGSLEVRHATS